MGSKGFSSTKNTLPMPSCICLSEFWTQLPNVLKYTWKLLERSHYLHHISQWCQVKRFTVCLDFTNLIYYQVKSLPFAIFSCLFIWTILWLLGQKTSKKDKNTEPQRKLLNILGPRVGVSQGLFLVASSEPESKIFLSRQVHEKIEIECAETLLLAIFEASWGLLFSSLTSDR